MKEEADIAVSQMKIKDHFYTLLHLMDGKDLFGSLSRFICKYRFSGGYNIGSIGPISVTTE